jgi:hypothetical protein
MRYVNVLVERSEHLSIPVTVPEWEVPILQFVHSAERVVINSTVHRDVEAPRADHEYERLERCYGADVKTERAFVAEIYGQPPIGHKGLEAAIKAASVPDKDDPTA